jgi:hypothetical protein
VIKPRRSCESRNTFRVASANDLVDLLPHLTRTWDDVGGYLIEELLIGDISVAGRGWGDYVSVESVVSDGEIHHVAVTGKFPLVETFREAGHFFPSTLRSGDITRCMAVATKAIHAIGVIHGMCHTELKLTSNGPRVIEVNGRLGGMVWRILREARGPSLLELAISTALGDDSALHEAITQVNVPGVVGYEITCYAADDHGMYRVMQVKGLEAVRDLSGVSAIMATLRKGDRIHRTMGSGSGLCHIYGTTRSHDSLAEQFRNVNDLVDAELY